MLRARAGKVPFALELAHYAPPTARCNLADPGSARFGPKRTRGTRLMRLITRTVYRAFPELDHFSDQQCLELVRAARGGAFRRTLRQLLRLAIAGMAMVGFHFGVSWAAEALGVVDWAVTALGLGVHTARIDLAGVLVMVDLCVGGVAWLLARDLLLRRAVRRALRLSGTCPACRYQLTGLAVAEGDLVICPECGFQLSLAAHGGQCLVGTDGLKRFMPSPDHYLTSTPWWTRQRRRNAARLALAMLMLPLVLAGAYELFIRWQAAQARADRTSAEQLRQLMEALRPADVAADAENAWDKLPRLIVALEFAAGQALGEERPGPRALGRVLAPSRRYYGDIDPGDRIDVLNIALIDPFLTACARDGLFNQMDQIARSPRVELVGPSSEQSPLSPRDLQDPTWLFSLSRLAEVRMQRARARGDDAEACRAFESALAVRRLIQTFPSMNLSSSADWNLFVICSEALRELHQRKSPEFAECISQAMDRQNHPPPPEALRSAQVECASDLLAAIFSDEQLARFPRWSTNPYARAATKATGGMFLGTYAEQREKLRSQLDRYLIAREQDPASRQVVVLDPGSIAEIALQGCGWNSRYGFSRHDQSLLLERELILTAALERFRSDTGDYPLTLSELCPRYLPALPNDPWNTGPFGYVRRPAAVGADASYQLFSKAARGDIPGGSFVVHGGDGSADGAAQAPAQQQTDR